MTEYIVVSIVSGILFGTMDGLINANPLARKLYAVYKPMAKNKVNVPAGIVIDIVYGFIMAGIFLLLYNSMPGEAGFVKGICFALIAWFFRVVMYAASQWMMFEVSVRTLFYTLITGLGEMLIIGMLYGWFLKPFV
ncbi:MAG: hypothetical protein WCG21_05585 [Eubacteriales bacterium]